MPISIASKSFYPDKLLTRGEAVFRILDKFDVKKTKKRFISACNKRPSECFFVFSIMSDFDGIELSPILKLYPDVNQNYRFYNAVNTASMLGLIHGYINEDETPFKPEVVMSRIQALKVILGATDLLKWKDEFELTKNELAEPLVYKDAVLRSPENWWYNRYLTYARDHKIITDSDFFRPDDPITIAELNTFMDNLILYSNFQSDDSQTLARRNSE